MLPDLFPIRQRLIHASVPDVGAAVQRALVALELHKRVCRGARVGIPAGSRGIRHIPLLLREVVRHVRSLGAVPVVAAAMGSHGSGNADGQREVLASLGITEAAVEAPIYSGEIARVVGHTSDGSPVYFDEILLGCDALLVLNRVKPHTSFRGRIESGLVKMLVVGCGKAAGARQFHALGPDLWGCRLLEFGGYLLHRLPVVGGIAVLENELDETADVVPVFSDRFIECEEALLLRAREMLPRLPVESLDLLVVDQMGKNFAGTGMDTNVIGRFGMRSMPDTSPHIRRLVALDLSDESHGNANGVGLADLVTRRLVSKIDFKATYLNTLTATALDRAKIPITLDADREVVETALRSIGSPEAPRIMRIKNTLDLQAMWVSHAVRDEIRHRPGIEVIGAASPWPFDARGNLL